VTKAQSVAEAHAAAAAADAPGTEQRRVQLLQEAPAHWNRFYSLHDNHFFRERRWLFTEFPELLAPPHASCYQILEVGCGNGATFLPLLKANAGRDAFVFGCDFSRAAVDIVRASPEYDAARGLAFVADISAEADAWPAALPAGSLDVVVLLFVLSALRPEQHLSTLARLARLLRPGGRLLLRDYGEHDLAQLRLKPARCLAPNWYSRGDNTLVYFFRLDELRRLLCDAGLRELRAHEDRRLQVNRFRRLKMYRVWVQAVFERPLAPPDASTAGAEGQL